MSYNRVGDNQIQKARQANLHGFLLKYHADTVEKVDRNRLRNKEYSSLIITRNMGYIYNKTGEKGNAVDYLTRFLGYEFKEAVRALCDFSNYCAEETPSAPKEIVKKGPFMLPKKLEGKKFSCTFGYLANTRKIDPKIVQDLIDKELLYEAEFKNNAVFVSSNCEYAEIEGTKSNVKYKKIADNSDYDGYWAYNPSCTDNENIKFVYICESAIDAISLFQIQQKNGENTNSVVYMSTGGAAKDKPVERAKKDFPNAEFVVATDDDPAGNGFAARHANLKRIKPQYHHDWNEELDWLWALENEDLPY